MSTSYSFETARKYFKAIAQKQNFKSLCLSIAKRYQCVACIDFGSDDECHPLFRNERQFVVLKSETKIEPLQSLRRLFDDFSLLLGIDFKTVYKVSWVIF